METNNHKEHVCREQYEFPCVEQMSEESKKYLQQSGMTKLLVDIPIEWDQDKQQVVEIKR